MRAFISPATTFAAAVLCAAAATARPAAAQQASHATARPDVARPSASAAAPRTVARYHFSVPRAAGARAAGMPAQVTVADSAGQLVASFRLRGGAGGTYPMLVTPIGSDLVLQGETPAGVVTLQLYAQSDPEALVRGLSGRWYLGGDEGRLTGRVAR